MDKFIGSGLSIPGILDRRTNKIIIAPNLAWNEVDLGTEISEALGMPAYIENEAMCSAICEHWIENAQILKTLSALILNRGLGPESLSVNPYTVDTVKRWRNWTFNS